MNILFFKPIPRPALWGHTLVKDYFQYHDFPDGIGQSWSFSAQEGASTICLSEPFQGKTLLELWNEHQELFGCPNEKFPVIISLVAPEDDLSIQVHPNDDYAKRKGYPCGKNEAWYFIESKPQAQIVYGHHAKDEQDLRQYIQDERWDDLIAHLDVHTGDFVYLPAGLLHALKKGSIVYEIQQATDITYRFYDYHRLDAQGQERELHLEDAIACLSYDPKDVQNVIEPVIEKCQGMTKTTFLSNDSFTVMKVDIGEKATFLDTRYQLATIVSGQGVANGMKVHIGDSFLIPKDVKVDFDGQMTIMMTTK